MEQKHKQEFALASATELSSSSASALTQSSPVFARFSARNGLVELRFSEQSEAIGGYNVDPCTAQLLKLGPVQSVCISKDSDTNEEKSYSRGITIQFRDEEESRAFHCAFEQWKTEVKDQDMHP